jgi:NAD(P)H dehydrogenase (quinone)
LVLVTGASGKTGHAVIAALARAGVPTRATVRRPAQIPEMLALGAQEAVELDLRLPDAMRGALQGITMVYHIGPNVHPEEAAIGRVAVEASTGAGVERFVLHSVLHPQVREMPHHWRKVEVEAALFESGLAFTILQPAPYMQNLLAGWADVIENGTLRNPYPIETRLSLVDLLDVADAAVEILTHESHAGATYELVGTPPLSQIEVARILEAVLGRPVQAEAESLEVWEARAAVAGIDEARRATLKAMFTYYARHGLAGNPNVLGWLLDRTPSSLEAFVRRAIRREDATPGASSSA